MSVSLRPGIYSSYEVSTDLSAEKKGLRIGIAAVSQGSAECTLCAGLSEAKKLFGASSSMTRLITAALSNGAPEILACPVADNDYEAAFKTLADDASVRLIICDTSTAQSRLALKSALDSVDERKKYKLGICELSGTVQELAQAAEELDCERMVLCGNAQKEGDCGVLSAAFAGLVAADTGSVHSYNFASLCGVGELECAFTDAETSLLIGSGVTPIEAEAGEIRVVRAVTTRKDSSWRDIGVILAVNELMPDVESALRRLFLKSKNNAQTRSAICTQVMLELEKKKKAGLISSYGKVRAAADADDASLCRVSFEFAVSRGLNTIELVTDVNV